MNLTKYGAHKHLLSGTWCNCDKMFNLHPRLSLTTLVKEFFRYHIVIQPHAILKWTVKIPRWRP